MLEQVFRYQVQIFIHNYHYCLYIMIHVGIPFWADLQWNQVASIFEWWLLSSWYVNWVYWSSFDIIFWYPVLRFDILFCDYDGRLSLSELLKRAPQSLSFWELMYVPARNLKCWSNVGMGQKQELTSVVRQEVGFPNVGHKSCSCPIGNHLQERFWYRAINPTLIPYRKGDKYSFGRSPSH